MTFIPYSKPLKSSLADLMTDYMAELNCGVPEDIIRGKLSDLIDRQQEAGIIRVDLALDQKQPVAFTIYQVDSVESDWYKRPGWGFIREFYVSPAYRNAGTGKCLALHTEQSLYSMGAKRLYLTSTGAVHFWQKCGWTLTADLCSNGQYILEK